MTFGIDEEAVVAESTLGRSRLQLRQVDGASGELLQDREQRTRTVFSLKADNRRLVVAGRRGNAAAEKHEAGLVLGVVFDFGGQHLEAVEIGCERVADRGDVRALRFRD